MKMKWRKRLFLTVALVLLGSGSVFAKTEGAVYDDASLLSDSEISELNESVNQLQEMTGWNIYAVTTEDAGGKSEVEYADDFFDAHSAGQENGIVALIDMDNRQIYLSTCGEAIRYLTDARIDRILDDAYGYVSEGAYKDCLQAMLNGTKDAYQAGIPNGQYNQDAETGAKSRYRSITVTEAVGAVLAAVLGGGVVFFAILGKYRLKFGTYKYAFRDFSKVNLRVKEDRFVHQTVTHRKIPKQTTTSSGHSSSGGRSTTHTSSSGRSHGGGGRSF